VPFFFDKGIVLRNCLNCSDLTGDERLLGDSDYVLDVLKETGERFERRYELKARGYNLDMLARRVPEIFHVRPEEILSPGKYKKRVEARTVLSYWAVRELGETASAIAKKIGISQPAVSLSVERGERIVRQMKLSLIPWFSVTKNKKFSLRLGVFARDMFLVAVIRVSL